MKNKIMFSFALAAVFSTGASHAALTNSSVLNFDSGVTTCNDGICTVPAGSYFGIDTDGNGEVIASERTSIVQNDGLILGSIQAASGGHSGPPDGTESPGIDAAWDFYSNTGLHFTTSATNVLSASGNTATIDFSGWHITWNDIAAISMGGGAWAGNADGVAVVSCAVDCAAGDTYTLDYSATIQEGDPSGLGGIAYQLHLVGTVSEVPVPAALWLFGSGLLALAGFSRRHKAA